MIQQLGCPTFFLTLSCADLKWQEAPEMISKLNNLNLSKTFFVSISYFEKCKLLNSNRVLLNHYFQHYVEIIIKSFLLSNKN